MKVIWKAFLIGINLIIIGAIIIIAVLAANDWKFTEDYEMKTYVAQNENTQIILDYGAGALRTEFYNGDKIEITYPETKSYKSSVEETDGKFIFRSQPKWYVSLFHWPNLRNTPETVVKLPAGTVFNVDIKLGAGTVTLAGGTYGTIKTEVSAGKLNAGGINCNTLELDVSAGSVNLSGINCSLLDCDVSAGKLAITALVCPVIDCDVSAGTISLAVTGVKSDYTIKTDIGAGSCNVSDQTGATDKRLNVDCAAGSVNVTFGD